MASVAREPVLLNALNKQDEPILSVLMPVRNSQAYVERAIESILEQSFPSFELIIIDDDSDVETKQILKAWSGRDSRILIETNRARRGVTWSLNRALSLARGSFIARHDADDWSSPQRFQTQLNFLDSNADIALVGTWTIIVDSRGEPMRQKKWPSDPAKIAERLVTQNVITHGSICARKELFERCGGYRDFFPVSQDRDLWLRAIEQFKLSNIPQFLYFLRSHDQSVSAQRKRAKQIAGRVMIDCMEARRRTGRDALGTHYGMPAAVAQVKSHSEKSYELLFAISGQSAQDSKYSLWEESKILAASLLLWPLNRPAWLELWWIFKRTARAVIRVV